MTELKLSTRQKALIWAAVGTPGLLAFMANVSAKEAATNLASWIELFGLPVPEFLLRAGIDEQVTQAVAALYGLLIATGSLAVLLPRDQSEPSHNKSNYRS